MPLSDEEQQWPGSRTTLSYPSSEPPMVRCLSMSLLRSRMPIGHVVKQSGSRGPKAVPSHSHAQETRLPVSSTMR